MKNPRVLGPHKDLRRELGRITQFLSTGKLNGKNSGQESLYLHRKKNLPG
jgi:hypothetical protein